jgi:hypothetical protein
MGREEKTIYFTPEIEQALVQYIRTERARHDPQGRKRLEQLADDEPVFLTRRGTSYTRSSWYYHWNKWLVAVPPDEYMDTLGPVLFTPHDVRHLYVSWILRQIKRRYANNPEKQATLKWALQQRMAWHSPLTIHCYDQSESDRERLEQFDTFLQELEQHTEEQARSPLETPACVDTPVRSTMVETTPLNPVMVSQSATGAICEIVPVIHRDLSDFTFWEDGL